MDAQRSFEQPLSLRPHHRPLPGSLQARVLGDVHLVSGKRPLPLDAWPRRSARSLLLLLLATPGHRLAREHAIDRLWPDLPLPRVRDTWYQALSTLRRTLEPGLPARQPSMFLSIDAASIALVLAPTSWIDVDAFETGLLSAYRLPEDERRASLRAVLALYVGDLFAHEPAVGWAIERREELHLSWQRAVLQLARLDLQAGEPLASEAALQAIVAADATAEEAHRALIRAYLATRERDKAVRQYERCRLALGTDLGIEPSTATQELVASSLARPSDEPLLRFVRSDTAPRRRPPAPATPLVGRDQEIALVEDLLWHPDVRLVTLIGPGGVGKTRLAIEVARRFERDEANVVFVPLAGIHAANLVLTAIAQALGVGNSASGSLLSAVIQRVDEHQILLVLDNFEHVIRAAVVVARLLANCPELTVLATSRAPLRLSAEHAVDVSPLGLPAARCPSFAALARSDAVSLFVQRAHAAAAAFTLTEDNAPIIAQICARLDGLPLAIELAAARVRVLAPQAIHTRLDRRLDFLTGGPVDAPARQRTMRDAIGWSYNLLDEEERAVFQRFSVFAGGATLAAATWVAVDAAPGKSVGPETEALPTSDLPVALPGVLGSLVDHGLLQHDAQADGEPRFSMLETVRDFATERLEASGEADHVRRRHAEYLIAFAETIVPGLKRSAQAVEVDQLAEEIDNVRAALAWALQHEEPAFALRLATATFQLWFVRAMPHEGRRWLEASLAAARDAPDSLQTDARLCASALAHMQGDFARQLTLTEEGLAVAERGGYRFGIAAALFQLGVAAEWQHDLALAASRYEEALGMMRQIGEPYWIALLLSNLGDVSLLRGHLTEAASLASEALVHWRALRNEWGIAQGLGTVAAVASEQNEPLHAAGLFRESLAYSVALGDRRGIAGTLAGLAGLLRLAGAPRECARLLGSASAISDAGNVRQLAHHVQYERVMTATRADLGDRVFTAEWEVGRARSFAEAISRAEAAATTIERSRGRATDANHACAAPVASPALANTADDVQADSNVIPLRWHSRQNDET